jgi:hypothetical protein
MTTYAQNKRKSGYPNREADLGFPISIDQDFAKNPFIKFIKKVPAGPGRTVST